VFAKKGGMQRNPTPEAIENIEKLVSELRAISHWDSEYLQRDCPERYETVAYVSRQKRRREILDHLESR
jgi:hypothetical protein